MESYYYYLLLFLFLFFVFPLVRFIQSVRGWKKYRLAIATEKEWNLAIKVPAPKANTNVASLQWIMILSICFQMETVHFMI